jgi:sugar/nucleoside kinase (ribokinase family)
MVDVDCAELPVAGARVHADVAVRAGGSAVNAARAAASAGAAATVVGRIGSDPAGDLVLAQLEATGIAAQLARDPELSTGAAVAFPGPTVVASRGANARFGVDDVPAAIDGDALLVSGFALFQSGSADAAALAIERFTGPWIGIDVASPKLAIVARDAAIPAAGRAVIVFATAEEAEAMTERGVEEAAHELASRFSIVCIKLGEDGAVAAAGSDFERRSAEKSTRRSSFGAGDAFAGAFLVAVAEGTPLGRALELACDAGAGAGADVRP